MNDYFSTVRQELATAVGRRAHLRWYRRLAVRHGRPLAVAIVALVVAAPAVGAVSGWFSQGRPDSVGPVSAGTLFGIVRPGHSRLLPIRVADPQGGPPWGLRLVRTTRGDTCVQLGRVQGGELGSLGIADAWDDDHEFHAISPSARDAEDCGSTDAEGHGFVNRGILGESASANLGGDWIRGAQASGCRLPVGGGNASLPTCPAGTNRIVFYGLLGPDAVSVTYRTPAGRLATERTIGGVGAYLLVFPYDAATCAEYDHTPGSSVSCDGEAEGGPSPVVPGAVTKVTYTDGRSCNLRASIRFESLLRAFRREALATLGQPPSHPRRSLARWLAAYRRLLARFLAREHLTRAQFARDVNPDPQCPAVGWVPFAQRQVTLGQVATRVAVHELAAEVYGCPNTLRLPDGCAGVTEPPSREVPVEWSFRARLPVTSSRSWYEWSLQTPARCDGGGGGESFATYSNIRAGEILSYSTFLPTTCHGTYRIAVGFMAEAPAGQTDDGGGGDPGHDGSIFVGGTSFTIR